MTELSVAVLVSVDKRDRYQVTVPGVDTPGFHGTSLSSLLDDATLHLMESIPKASPAEMPRYAFNPYVELRKVRVEVTFGDKRSSRTWKGRIAVVVSRWSEDDFFVACAPRLGTDSFAVRRLSELSEALADRLRRLAEDDPSFDPEPAACWYDDFLQVLTFETELPTILPSQPQPRGRGMRARRKKKREAAKVEETKKKRRRLVAPTELRAVAQSLTHRALDGRLPRAFLRDPLVETILEALARDGAAVLLVGPDGVGKRAVVAEVVRRIALQASGVQDRQEVWSVDGHRIISGMSFVGQWEARVRNMVDELSARQDILFVEDLPSLVYAGRTSHGDTHVAEYLEPHLARKEIRMLGTCTPERWLATRDEAPGFFGRFRVVPVEPMDERATLVCLAHALRARAETDEVTVTPDGMEAVLGLTRRFEPASVNPGRAVRLLERVLADRAEVPRDELGRRAVNREAVVEHFARSTGLPRFVLWQQEARDAARIQGYFERRIVAQPAAVEAAVDVVSLLEQGLNDPGRPLSSFLFVGPTGVGKTETAKALAAFLFGSADRLVRFDMSEFMAPYSVGRLIGDRFQPEGELTRRVHQQPFSVVLLDEIEKAHPAVHDALLQVLGEGRLTNAAGQTVSFANAVVVMTSNLGVREARARVGFEAQDVRARQLHFRRAAEKAFRPEFFNRIDRIVPFDDLGRDAIVPLVRRLLEQMLQRRGLQRSSVVVEVDPALVEVLVDEGFDPRYGARSVKRILEQRLAVPLAAHLVRHHLDQLTIAELYPRGGEIRMDLSAPVAVETRRVEGPPPVRDWASAAARIQGLRARVDGLQTGAGVSALRDERAALLDAVDGYAEDARTARLNAVSAMLSQLDRVDARVADLEEAARVPDHEERFVVEQVPSPRLLYRGGSSRRSSLFTAAPLAKPIRGQRDPFSDYIRAEVEALEVLSRALGFLARALTERDHAPVLLALRPVGIDPGARDLVVRLGRALSGAWSGVDADASGHDSAQDRLDWLSFSSFWTRDDRIERFAGWPSTSDLAEDAELQAVLLEGPGARALVASEIGVYADVEEVGADRLTRVARIDEVPGAGDPVPRLEAWNAAFDAYRGARREGEADSPLPEVPLVRSGVEGVAVDPSTGMNVRFGSAGDLLRVSLLRLFADEEAEG